MDNPFKSPAVMKEKRKEQKRKQSQAWRARNPEESKRRCRNYYSGNRDAILTKKKDRHPNYCSWRSMIDRCNNSNRDDYKHYGGRGIAVCERWLSFENFNEDMGTKPTADHTIERDNVNGNYEPSNCRWATRQEQQLNKR